jgi:hypothetical protein
MSIEQILIVIVGLGCGLLGWLGRVLWDAVKKLQTDLSALEVKIGTDYIRYDRLQDSLKPIMEALAEIKSTLSHKVDK